MRRTKMATSVLKVGRLGSLQCLRQVGWLSLRTPLASGFCTKTEAPKKPAKKASSKTLEAPDERTALLAYKTTVAFPSRLSTPGFLSQGVAIGEYEQSVDPVTDAPSTPQVSVEASSKESVATADSKQAKSVADGSAGTKSKSCDVFAATEEDATSPTSADVEAPKDDDGTSSSSSSSDSESDSDSDDEKHDKTEIAEPAAQAEDKAGQEGKLSAAGQELAPDTKIKTEHLQPSASERAVKEAPRVVKAASEPTSVKVPASSTASAPSEEIVDPAPVLYTAESVKACAEVIAEKETGVAVKSFQVPDAKPEPVTKGAHAEPTPEVILDSATVVASEPGAEIQAAAETTGTVAAAEELADTAPLITDAEGVTAEPEVAAAPEEAAAAPSPEPEPEPFDNTTYQNLQHHNYNIYTFVDMDVEMAKYRQPQPSTGRPSPLH